MKKTAVLIYDTFCNFEISVALEITSLSGKEITVFATNTNPVKSEEGLKVVPDKSLYDLDINEYDSLLLPGAMDIRDAIENNDVIEFIQKFNGKTIGAISIAPILLVKAGLLNGKPFMIGANKEELIEEGFSDKDLIQMIGWDDNLSSPIDEGYLIHDNIVTSVSYNFVKFGLAFGKLLKLDISSKTFGLDQD